MSVIDFPGTSRRRQATAPRRRFVPIDGSTQRAIKARAYLLSQGDYLWYRAKLEQLVMWGEVAPEDVLRWFPEELDGSEDR